MTVFLGFVLGLWVGCSLGFLLFACVQVSRDDERAGDEMSATAIPGSDRRMRERRRQSGLFAPGARKAHAHSA